MTDYFDLYKEKNDECLECPFFKTEYNKEHQKIIYECKGQHLKTWILDDLKDNCCLINIEDVLKEFINFMDAYDYINKKEDIDMNYLIQKFME